MFNFASLMPPRALLLEIGSSNAMEIEPRRLIDIELARVTALYRKLGIPKKVHVASFDGPPKGDGAEAYPFLNKMLNWTPPR